MLDSSSTEWIGENESFSQSGAQGGAVGVDSWMTRPVELWQCLANDDRLAIVAHAEQLSAVSSASTK